MTLRQRLDGWFADRYDRMTGPVEEAWLAQARRDLLRDASGEVLEIGPGTGSNADAYPAAVRHLTLAEPSAAMRSHLQERYADHALPHEIVPDAAESLTHIADASMDAVVSTLVLCSVGDPARCLAEVRRVLRPGGRLLVLEHVWGTGRHARLQRLVTPVTVRLAAGCRHDRDTAAHLAAAGFDVSGVTDTGHRIAGFTYPVVSGAATKR